MEKKHSRPDTTTREFEERQLRLILDTIAQQIEAIRLVLRGERQDRRAIGKKDYNSSVVLNWKHAYGRETLEVRQAMQNAPYFGRIDFIQEGRQDEELIYIGKATLQDENNEFLVYDWRAPISSMYYQFNPGVAHYQAPSGIIRGSMTFKRSYEIEDGKITATFDVADTVGDGEKQPVDEMLVAILQRNSTGHMRQIVQSIQSEQDTIVRSDGDVVVIQGPAGSGKTVIALHRAAYLLFHMRLERERRNQQFGNVSAQRMLVLSPNSIFSDHISRVLPDLNEGQIRQVVLGSFLENELRKLLSRESAGGGFDIETKDDHYEYVLDASDPNYQVREAGARFKQSVAMLDAIDQFIHQHEAEVEAQFTDILLDPTKPRLAAGTNNVFYGREEMLRILHVQRDNLSLIQRIEAVVKELETRTAAMRRRAYVAPATISHIMRAQSDFAKALNGFRQVRLLQLYAAFWNNPNALEEAMLQGESNADGDNVPSIGPNRTYWLARCAQHTLDTLQAKRIPHEDIVAMLLLAGAMFGFPPFSNVDHALVDEAQDYTLLHYEYIRRCLPDRCGLTIVGDIHQATNPCVNIGTFDGLRHVFPQRVTRLELTRSYRSSLEITEFARRILPGRPRIDNVRQTGHKPKLVPITLGQTSKTIIAIVKLLTERGYNSIAILCKTRRAGAALYRHVQHDFPVTLMTGETDKFGHGVFVVPLVYAKGLEFDAVIIEDVSAAVYSRESERNALYTACTRALHDLYLCYEGEVTHLLPIQVTDLYERFTP